MMMAKKYVTLQKNGDWRKCSISIKKTYSATVIFRCIGTVSTYRYNIIPIGYPPVVNRTCRNIYSALYLSLW